MVNIKVEITTNDLNRHQSVLNKVLERYDARQIVKIDTLYTTEYRMSTIITYVELEDLRELKIENILDNGLLTIK